MSSRCSCCCCRCCCSCYCCCCCRRCCRCCCRCHCCSFPVLCPPPAMSIIQPGAWGRSSPGSEAAWGPKQPGGGSSPGPKQPAHGSLNVLRAAPELQAALGAPVIGAARPGLVAAAPGAHRHLDDPLWQNAAGCLHRLVGLGAGALLGGPRAALPPTRLSLPCGLVGRLLGPLIGIDAWSVDLVGWLAGWFVRFVGWLVESGWLNC